MEIRKKIFALAVLSIFYSCSTSKISDSEVVKCNGIYEANNVGNEAENAKHYNFISLLNRKLIKDTLWEKPIFYYKFKIEVTDKKHIEITIINELDKIVAKRRYNFRKKEEHIILKNKNTQTSFIPYLAGALDIRKLRIKSNENKSLNVEITEHRSGGVFMIPMGWSNTKKTEKYKRVE
ncbi:hypothetical protein [Flavobacterium phycosphaerae]|uniref:hypothetical protein n=1 Tax=Flavobacterium phycosphaerae TaxID=2697515 RepID=UPI00138ADDE8|nr:hypothetical protein [Flavobacterium phycosphaerae]